MAAAKYKSWTVPKLKTELIQRGAVITGRKENLIERLLAYDRNQDFRPPPIILPDELHNNVDWPKSGYQQLMSDHRIFLSKLTSEQIDEYFLYRLAGAPVRAEHIPTKRKLKKEILSDPRPSKYRNNPGYSDYCSLTSHDIAMRYLLPRTHIQAAQRDHDYLNLPFGEYWVDKALQLTEEEARKLETETRGQSTNKQWFNGRHWRLTASRFGELCKITNRRNIETFLSKNK